MRFFDKEHILISRRYQLNPASATTVLATMQMHTAKKEREELQKRKFPLK
jgi:hypothetical protein